MKIKEKLNPCSNCGKVDKIRAGVTTIGCTRCGLYYVTTRFDLVPYAWNYHNKITY